MEDKNLLELELQGILESSNDNIVVTDGVGKVLRVSSNCTKIYGREKQYFIGKTAYQLEKEDIFSPSVTVKVLKDRKNVQVMQKTPAGKVVMATGIPIFNEQKEIVRVLSFSHDLTEIQNLREDYEELLKKMKKYEMEIEELREKEMERESIVNKSKAMERVWDLVKRVSKSDATVVFLGESGVGKTIFARALHNNSERNKEPFVEVNCGAIPSSLFESEMFGYEGGSFTGANRKGKSGLIERAHKGTLFLDEIGELPLHIQVKLLKVLQEKKVTSIGSTDVKDVDFRLIAATNQDLEEKVKSGKFRKDLYYRINVIPIKIPPLRERKEDIYELLNHFIDVFNHKYGCEKYLHPTTIEELVNHDWPGNVRELENLLERLVVTSEGNTIHTSMLPFTNERSDIPREEINWSLDVFENKGLTLKDTLMEVEQRWLERAYRQYKTTYEMAGYLGLSQATVVRRLNKYGINSK